MCCKIVVYGNDKRQQSLANNLPGKRMEGQCQDPQLVILRSENPNYDDIEVPRSDIRELMFVQNILHVDTRM